jgi:hypothetical protein
VKLDGKCYSFYAFANDVPVGQNPFTNQKWSDEAEKKIGLIRVYQSTLQREEAHFSSKMGGDITSMEQRRPTRQRLGKTSRTRKLYKE